MMRRAVCIALLLLPSLLHAQGDGHQLSVDADFLTRGEIRDGGLSQWKPDSEKDRAAFILGRTRVGVEYAHKGFSGRISAQHSGTWGDDGAIGVYEAWVQYKSDPGFFAKVGRQDLSYDDQRIFGSDSWSMTGMSHDVLKAGYEGHGHKVHLFAAYNQNAENMNGGSIFHGGYQSYKELEALWYHYDVTAWNLGLSAVFLNVGMQGGDNMGDLTEIVYHQQLAGGYVSFKPKGWAAEAAYYRQMGKYDGGIPIEAWMTSAKVTATPSDTWQFTAGYDYLSGDDSFATPEQGQMGLAHHDKIKGFNSIFGSHHKFYGAMDFFYVSTYVGGFTPGLQNAYAGTRWSPIPSIAVDASYHLLSVATKVHNMSRALGHEVELSASWSFSPGASLSLGYSFMQGTELMEVLKRVSGNHRLHWGWLMLRAHPTMKSIH